MSRSDTVSSGVMQVKVNGVGCRAEATFPVARMFQELFELTHPHLVYPPPLWLAPPSPRLPPSPLVSPSLSLPSSPPWKLPCVSLSLSAALLKTWSTVVCRTWPWYCVLS